MSGITSSMSVQCSPSHKRSNEPKSGPMRPLPQSFHFAGPTFHPWSLTGTHCFETPRKNSVMAQNEPQCTCSARPSQPMGAARYMDKDITCHAPTNTQEDYHDIRLALVTHVSRDTTRRESNDNTHYTSRPMEIALAYPQRASWPMGMARCLFTEGVTANENGTVPIHRRRHGQ
jgi:hypothetical protein